MAADVAHLIVSGKADPLPLEDPRESVRVVIASLAPGGAERIVVDWLSAEAHAGRACELAVLNARRLALKVPAGVRLIERRQRSVEDFMAALGRRWRGARAPISHYSTGKAPDLL